jgi:hypothetical protein
VDDEQEPRLDAERFPCLATFVPGYLHQDLIVVHRDAAGAVEAWREDAGSEAAQALALEWRRFLAATDGLDLAARTRVLEASFGGAWAPQTAEEFDALTAALTAALHDPQDAADEW